MGIYATCCLENFREDDARITQASEHCKNTILFGVYKIKFPPLTRILTLSRLLSGRKINDLANSLVTCIIMTAKERNNRY